MSTRLISAALVVSLAGCNWSTSLPRTTSDQVKTLMTDPPREYATAPLWVWNDLMTDEQITGTLRDLAGQGVKQAFVHPRPGLMTPYLSQEWFRCWKVALAEARRLDMNLWIYDENSYPSGFAGGWVPEQMPESRGQGLIIEEYQGKGEPRKPMVGAYRVEAGAIVNVTERVAGSGAAQAGDLIAWLREAPQNPWHGDRFYVDLLKPGVTEKFLEVTLEAYKRNIGDEFGRHVPGSFTDEPNIRPAGGLPWTDDLPQVFERRWGYALLDQLPALTREAGDWKRVRHNYYATLNELFIERWAQPYGAWCAKNGLEFTGHYWEHDWPDCAGVPDNMAMYAWHQRPAIDCLMNQYHDDVHAQFGNVRSVKELSSVANQIGQPRTLCEAYGAGGWDLRFEDMKRIGDFLYVLGVNTLDEHLSYATIRGARKRDHPQSFSYHEPWWPDYHVMANYFARLSAVMSQGEQVNRVLVLEPTTTAWMYNRPGGEPAPLKELGDSFQKLINDLEAAQVEYDLGDEDIMTRHGAVAGAELKIGRRGYTKVILPAGMENLNAKTLELLTDYVRQGGWIQVLGPPPALVEGRPSDAFVRLLSERNISPSTLSRPALEALAEPTREDYFGIRRAERDQGILFHHRRRLADGQIVLLVNTSIEHAARGELLGPGQGVEQWDLHSGRALPYPFTVAGEPVATVRAGFELPPCGSLPLFLSTRALPAANQAKAAAEALEPVSGMRVEAVGPNVLTLDYVDITAGGETRKDAYVYQAGQFAFQRNGMPRNPWDSAVQFKDELITRRFPADSGFEASYKFTIVEQVPPALWIVIERPDLYTITCNGRPVAGERGQWWLDRAFGRIDLSGAARLGENVITLKAAPFSIFHELESAYVLGEFSLRPAARGFEIAPPEPLKLGRWNEQGSPFYSQGVTYAARYNAAGGARTGVESYRLALKAWYGSVARVRVNGRDCGRIMAAPWECDITAAVQPGDNLVEITVVGTLKNTLGPHHGQPGLGSAWPGSFHQAPAAGPPPGTAYHTVGYGLFEPFVIKRGSR